MNKSTRYVIFEEALVGLNPSRKVLARLLVGLDLLLEVRRVVTALRVADLQGANASLMRQSMI